MLLALLKSHSTWIRVSFGERHERRIKTFRRQKLETYNLFITMSELDPRDISSAIIEIKLDVSKCLALIEQLPNTKRSLVAASWKTQDTLWTDVIHFGGPEHEKFYVPYRKTLELYLIEACSTAPQWLIFGLARVFYDRSALIALRVGLIRKLALTCLIIGRQCRVKVEGTWLKQLTPWFHWKLEKFCFSIVLGGKSSSHLGRVSCLHENIFIWWAKKLWSA